MRVVGAARDRSGMIVLITATTMASLIPLAVGDATDTLFGSIALATAGGTLFGTIGAMWVLPLMLMPLRKPKFRFWFPKIRIPKFRLPFKKKS
jgi:multidrug efflux pump subunit AcrB